MTGQGLKRELRDFTMPVQEIPPGARGPFSSLFEADQAGRKLMCSECTSSVEPQLFNGTMYVWCVRSKGQHQLRQKGLGVLAKYWATGQGSAITIMQAQRRMQMTLERTNPKARAIVALFEANQASITSLLPRHVEPDRILRTAYLALQENPALLECTPDSVLSAVLQTAALGLEPGNQMGQAYLVPYGDKCQLIVGYRGHITLMHQSGAVAGVSAEVVREGDHFQHVLGMNPDIVHVLGKVRGALTHAYAIVQMRSGAKQVEVMPKDEILKVRDRSPAFSKTHSGPWITDEPEMWKKTVIRRIRKLVPQSATLQRVEELETQADEGMPQRWDIPIPHPALEAGQVLDTSTGEIQEPQDARPALVCPLHSIAWRSGDYGPFHPVPGSDLCNPNKAALKMATEAGWSEQELNGWLKINFGVTRSQLKDLSQFAGFVQALQPTPEGEPAAAESTEEAQEAHEGEQRELVTNSPGE